MKVLYAYLIKGSQGMDLEDEIHLDLNYRDESEARETLEKGGFVQVDDKNYEKKLDDTLYYLATLVKL